MKSNENNNQNSLNRIQKFQLKDIVAMTVAIFELLTPIITVAFVVLAVVILFITKVWLK